MSDGLSSPELDLPASVYSDGRRKRRRTCSGCSQNFAERYFRDHKCHKAEVTTDESEDSTASSDGDDEEVPRNNLRRKLKDSVRRSARNFLSEHSSFEEWENVVFQDIINDTHEISDQQSEETSTVQGTAVTLVTWLCLFLSISQAINCVSDRFLHDILLFLKAFFSVLATQTGLPLLSCLATLLPGSLYLFWQFWGVQKDNFQKFVVCQRCYTLYSYQSCVAVIEGKRTSAKCSYIPFPHHPQRARRRPCNEVLLKSVKLSSGQETLYPCKSFCYKPIKQGLQKLLQRPGFEERCNAWREKTSTEEDRLTDIFDGQIWQEFLSPDRGNFLCSPDSYGLMLNVDWFEPFKHVKYSVGVIYAVVLSLPRHERFKLENVLLLGTIPDFKTEPPLSSFIQPLVDELKDLWDNGMVTSTHNSPRDSKTVKAALLCVGCDVPATRKLCGFLGHAATLGCSKCNKTFPGGIGMKDYSGFDTESWPKKNLETVRADMLRVKAAKTATERSRIASELGVRHSPLIELKYFDVVRMAVIDPMHNLFLGTAKLMVHIWIDSKLLTPDDFDKIQGRVDSMAVPKCVGRIPRKIASSFSGFTAEQWMNWTIIFSLYALAGVLQDRFLRHWALFVQACRILCQTSLTKTDIRTVQNFLVRFCQVFENVYGTTRVTPNLHLHCHLTSCILDYGPVHEFWLFSFERFNGHLGNLPKNNLSVEMQFMRRFLRDDLLASFKVPKQFEDVFLPVLPTREISVCLPPSTTSRLSRLADPGLDILTQDWTDIGLYEPVSMKRARLSPDDMERITAMYQRLYHLSETNMYVHSTYQSCSAITVGKVIIGTAGSRYWRSSFVRANWNAEDGNIVNTGDTRVTPGIVVSLLKHCIEVDGICKVHLLAKVLWYLPLQTHISSIYPCPVELWSHGVFDAEGASSFLPLQRVLSTFVQAEDKVNNRRVIVVCPTNRIL